MGVAGAPARAPHLEAPPGQGCAGVTGQTSGEQAFDLLGYEFRVRWDAPVGKQVVAWLYPSHRVDASSCPRVEYVLTTSGAGTQVRVGGEQVGSASEAGRIFGILEHAVANAALESLHEVGSVHAGAVARGESVLLLPGDGGSGKTTLTLALSLAGLSPLADDVTLIDTDAGLLRAFPRPFMVKGDTARWVSDQLPGAGTWPEVGGETYAVPRERVATPAEVGQLKWVVYPNYQPESGARVEELGQAEAFRRLTPLTSLVGEAWMPFVRQFRRARTFGLTYSDREGAAQLVLGLMAEAAES